MMREQRPAAGERHRVRPPSAIFWQALREHLPAVLAWGAGYSAFLVLAVLLYSVLRANNVLLGLLAGFGVLDRFAANYGVNTDAVIGLKGYLSFQVLAWGPIILALYSVPKAMNVMLDEEKRGTLDLLLSAPLPRWQFLTEKTLALLLSIAGIIAIIWLTLMATLTLTPTEELTRLEGTYVVWHLMPISTAIMSAGLLASVLAREARTALSVTAGFVLVSFFVRAFADSTRDPRLLELARFSVFNYYSAITILSFGPQPQWDARLLGVSVILFVLALVAFQRRDLR